MSDGKLTFNEFINKEFDDVDVYCGVNKLSHYDISKISWDFAEAQEKREYELLEEEHSELLANFCKVDIERIKLSREIDELKIKFSEATKTYTDEIEELEQENKSLKKKLSEAVEVIRFYGNTENYHQRKEDVFDYIQSDVSFENYSYFGGKRARAFLKGDKDE